MTEAPVVDAEAPCLVIKPMERYSAGFLSGMKRNDSEVSWNASWGKVVTQLPVSKSARIEVISDR